MNSTIMKEVVTQLRAAGFGATYEYPGYIALGERSYGTANGNWGWSDEDGNGAETDLPGNCAQPDLIVAQIIKIENQRDGAPDPNEEAFLEEVAAHLRTDASLDAETVHTGGGIYCIDVKFNGGVMLRFGTSDVNWGADVYVNGDFLEGRSINTTKEIDFDDASSAAVNVMEIAMAFEKEQWEEVARIGLDKQKEQISVAAKDAIEEFWTVVAAKFPEVSTGDFPPDLTHEFYGTAVRMIIHWLKFNR